MYKTGLKQLDLLGYEKFDFLTQDEVYMLINFYEEKNKRRSDYDSTYAEFSVLDAEINIRHEIFNFIVNLFMPKLNNILPGFKAVLANYVVKEPSVGIVPLHQNWSLVDETKYSSYSIWVPLIDVDENNGTLEFIPKSHLGFRGPRGGRGHMPFEKIEEQILNKFSKIINASAGQAIFLDDSILHYSRPNKTDKKRIAIQLIVIPEEAEILYYDFQSDKEKQLCNVYEVNPDFFQNMVYWKGDLSQVNIKGNVIVYFKKYNYFSFIFKYYWSRFINYLF